MIQKKTSEQKLGQRGFLEQGEHITTAAQKRTARARTLGSERSTENLISLCEMLKTEKSLYTKIAICESIEAYGVEAIQYLDPLVGFIGNNQHREPNNADLGKKTYPLPRDIVARIMIRLGTGVIDYYRGRLHNYDEKQVSEIIDVIGHISYHYNENSMAQELLDLYQDTESKLIKYKCIKSFRSFDLEAMIMVLEYETRNPQMVLANEAKRSLARLRQNKP